MAFKWKKLYYYSIINKQPRDRTQVSNTAGRFLPSETPGKPMITRVGSLIPSPGDFPDPGMEPGSPALQADSLPAELPGKPCWRRIRQASKEPFPWWGEHCQQLCLVSPDDYLMLWWKWTWEYLISRLHNWPRVQSTGPGPGEILPEEGTSCFQEILLEAEGVRKTQLYTESCTQKVVHRKTQLYTTTFPWLSLSDAPHVQLNSLRTGSAGRIVCGQLDKNAPIWQFHCESFQIVFGMFT